MNEVVKNEETLSFAEKYEIQSDKYIDTPITSLSFSTRVINRFMANGITTVGILLNNTADSIMNIKGFGKNCLDEVELVCKSINENNSSLFIDQAPAHRTPTFLKSYAEAMALGDFSFENDLTLSEEDFLSIQKYKEAYNIIGEELAFNCVVSPDSIIPIINMLSDYQETTKHYIELWSLMNAIPYRRRENMAVGYINAFTLSDIERKSLYDLCESNDSSIDKMLLTYKDEDYATYLLLKKFFKWCTFNLSAEIKTLFEDMYSNERMHQVIVKRAQKQTLEQIGVELGVTRERVRQIEVKAKRKFSHLHSRIRIISKIAAERNGDPILTPSEIKSYCGTYTEELLFLLKSYESANYTYDQQLDVFIIGDDSLQERVQRYLDTLPAIVKSNQLSHILNIASEDEDIPAEMLEKAFLEVYRLTGEVYHRHRLSLAQIYENILDSHYPNGIRAYDPTEIKHFRDLIAAEYGNVSLPENDRAITARITSICILCGRGVYKPKKKQYIPKELANRIHNYIVDNENAIFLTNTLYNIFEEDLIANGVENKYYLQGILHELFSDEFLFRRDYISKDPNITSVYSAISDYIQKSQYPVSKAEIQQAFPGITEIVLNFAINENRILNYFGEYLHASKLNISNSEKEYLYNFIKMKISDGDAHHIKEFYEIIQKEKPEIFFRNAAMFPFSAFSILEYLFSDSFQFSRPYIALNGVDIGSPAERLHDLIYSEDVFAVNDISEFARENHFQIQSILDFINDCNDQFLLVNETTMMKINEIGVTEEIAHYIDSILDDEVKETMPIYQLSSWVNFPKINVQWSDWLIYSVLNKWGEKVVVSTSSNQFRLSVPLISPIGHMDINAFKDLVPTNVSFSAQVDDLDKIDELLEDIIESEFLEEDI